jgi:hypothetical protein
MTDMPIFPDTPEDAEGWKRLWNKVGNNLGWNDMNMNRNRPYCGQPHTDTGERGKTEIKGVTFRDLRDCFIRAVFLCAYEQNEELYNEARKGENAALCESDLYKLDLNKLDIMAISQNLACEVEKIMGIYPNVPKLHYEGE